MLLYGHHCKADQGKQTQGLREWHTAQKCHNWDLNLGLCSAKIQAPHTAVYNPLGCVISAGIVLYSDTISFAAVVFQQTAKLQEQVKIKFTFTVLVFLILNINLVRSFNVVIQSECQQKLRPTLFIFQHHVALPIFAPSSHG